MPTFRLNLFSVNKLITETHLSLTFYKTHCNLQILTSNEVIAVAGVQENLYILNSKSFDPDVINSTFISLWHQRMGHCSSHVLHHISAVHISKDPLSVYDTCHLAKQPRLLFPTSHSRATSILERLHTDLWGPYKTPSLNSAHYILTILENYSRVTWTYSLKYKIQVPNTSIHFINTVQKQYDKSVNKFDQTMVLRL